MILIMKIKLIKIISLTIKKKMIINQAEYDNISKIVQQISRYTDTLFEINPTLFIAFLKNQLLLYFHSNKSKKK